MCIIMQHVSSWHDARVAADNRSDEREATAGTGAPAARRWARPACISVADEYDRERYEADRADRRGIAGGGSRAVDRTAAGGVGGRNGLRHAEDRSPRRRVPAAATTMCCSCARPTDGLWTLPGGWADVNDSPSGAIRREIEQEAGFRVRVAKLAALYDRNAHGHTPSIFHSWKAFFLCEIEGGAGARQLRDRRGRILRTRRSCRRCRSAAARRQQVQRMYQHWQQRELPTDFD